MLVLIIAFSLYVKDLNIFYSYNFLLVILIYIKRERCKYSVYEVAKRYESLSEIYYFDKCSFVSSVKFNMPVCKPEA